MDKSDWSKGFFSHLEKRADSDNAVVATLRRSLSFEPGTDARTFPYIEPFIGNTSVAKRQLIYLIAGLWAQTARRSSGKPLSIAAAMRKVATNDSVSQRFTRLLDSDVEELRWRLRQTLNLIASKRIAINWPQLLDDVLGWQWSSRSVQIRWAREFWKLDS